IKSVSRHLNISISTAKAHTEMLYQRLDVHSRNQAIYKAVSLGATLGWREAGMIKPKDEGIAAKLAYGHN
ncbi:MAG: LuxR C-terminal-related transcriptional regulator, partial [Burkholderiaceae bacterium]